MYWLQRGWGTHTLFSKSRAHAGESEADVLVTHSYPNPGPVCICGLVAFVALWSLVDSAQDCEVVSHLHYNSCQYQTTPQHPVSELTRSLISITISPTQQR